MVLEARFCFLGMYPNAWAPHVAASYVNARVVLAQCCRSNVFTNFGRTLTTNTFFLLPRTGMRFMQRFVLYQMQLSHWFVGRSVRALDADVKVPSPGVATLRLYFRDIRFMFLLHMHAFMTFCIGVVLRHLAPMLAIATANQ